MHAHLNIINLFLMTLNHFKFVVLGKGNTSRSVGVAEELEEQIKAGAIG